MSTPATRPRVLVVDDDEAMRSIVESILNERGLDVVAVASGPAALREAEAGRFDVAISDFRMPGMDGLQVLRALREIDPNVRVIILTAYASGGTARECMDSGAFDYIGKPFMLDDFVSRVGRAVAYSPSSGALC